MKKIGIALLMIFMFVPLIAVKAENINTQEMLMLELNLMQKYDDDTFRSDTFITNGEFLNTIERMSNSRKDNLSQTGLIRTELDENRPLKSDDLVFAMAKILNNHVENYKKYASDEGLFKNVNFINGYVTRGEFAQFVYNTLLAKKATYHEIKDNMLVLQKDTTLLYELFGVEKITGVAEADSSAYITQTPKTTLAENEMLINGIRVAGISDTSRYIGRKVTVFAKFSDDLKTDSTAVLTEEEKNNILTVNAEFIDGATTSKKIVWLDEDAKNFKEKAIPSDAVVIYNGERKGLAKEQEWSLFTPIDGEVNLIDNNNDGKYDVVVIFNYKTYVVEYVNAANKTIFDKMGNAPISIEEKLCHMFDKTGETFKLEDIKPNDVLSVMTSENGEKITIRRANPSYIEGIYQRDGYTVWINNDNYSICGGGSLNGAENGDKVRAYLDIYNRVAFLVRQSVYDYAYLSKSICGEEDGETLMYLNLYTFDDEAVKEELADVVTVYFGREKVKYYKNKKNDNSFEVLQDRISGRSELIKIRKNNDGKIKEIVFPKNKIGQNMPDTSADFEIYYGWETGNTFETRHAKFLQNSFESKYRLTQNTKILSLSGNPQKPENFARISMSDLVADSDYSIAVYDVNEKFEAGAIVIYRIEDWYYKFGSIVAKVTEECDEDGRERIKFVLYTLGEESTVFAYKPDMQTDQDVSQRFENSDVKISDIEPGDIIYYNAIGNDVISSFAVLHKNKNGGEFYHRSNYGWGGSYIPNAAMAVTYCKVEKTYSDLIVAEIDGARPIGEYAWRNYYIFDNSSKKLTKASFQDIKAGDSIVGLWKWSNMNDLIIYR